MLVGLYILTRPPFIIVILICWALSPAHLKPLYTAIARAQCVSYLQIPGQKYYYKCGSINFIIWRPSRRYIDSARSTQYKSIYGLYFCWQFDCATGRHMLHFTLMRMCSPRHETIMMKIIFTYTTTCIHNMPIGSRTR